MPGGGAIWREPRMEALAGASERQLSELLALRTGASGAQLRALTHDVLRQMMRSGIGAPPEPGQAWVGGTSHVVPPGLPPAGCGVSAASRIAPPSRCGRLDGAAPEQQQGMRFAVDDWHRMCASARPRCPHHTSPGARSQHRTRAARPRLQLTAAPLRPTPQHRRVSPAPASSSATLGSCCDVRDSAAHGEGASVPPRS
jgi:hypothetical protein